MKKLLFLSAAAVLVLAGCGGGSSTPQNVPFTPTLITPETGQRWTYSITGTRVQGATNQAITGTERWEIISRVGARFQIRRTQTLNIGGTPFNDVRTWTYDRGASIVLVSDNLTSSGAIRTVTTNSYNEPTDWTIPVVASGTTVFDNGDQFTATVQATSQVEVTALGRKFVAADARRTENRVPFTGTSSDVAESSTFSPAVGRPVTFRRVTTVNSTTAEITTLEGVLTSTNVSLP